MVNRALLLNPIKLARRFASVVRSVILTRHVNRSWQGRASEAATHNLPAPVLISLTSHPPRFSTLHLTIKSLLAQSVKADEILLWIADEDIALLPCSVLELQPAGLRIRSCPNLRSYKKIIPLLRERPNCYILIADDDVYYYSNWLKDLLKEYRPGRSEVLCHRAHGIRVNDNGLPLPYREWKSELRTKSCSRLVFPTGVGGVLYPPRSFHADVTREDLFSTLCPTTDDIWLFWMASLKGAVFRRVDGPANFPSWTGSQTFTLHQFNAGRGGGNDVQMSQMLCHYGFPAAVRRATLTEFS